MLQRHLRITGSTTTDNSFIQIAGHADWGLENIAPGFGEASTFIELFPDTSGTSTVYVTQTKDGDWIETTDGGEFDSNDVPYWTPIFLDKGELTFDTSGSLGVTGCRRQVGECGYHRWRYHA